MPIFKKIPKETKEKTKQKKTKAVKTKEKKAKQPKIAKNKKALILLVAVLIIVILGSALTIFILTLKKKDTTKEQPPKAPDYYFSKDEDISSFTTIVGNRHYAQVTSDSLASEHNEEIEKGSTKYQYEIKKDSDDLERYKKYLEDEKNFIDVTGLSESTKPSKESDDDEKEKEEMVYQLAGPCKDSSSYLSILLKTHNNRLTVETSEENQPYNMYLKDQWAKQIQVVSDLKSTSKATNSIEQAENSVRSLGEKLGLPEKPDSYEYIAAPGISYIDGKNYYTVRTYKRQPDDTLAYIATYLCDYSTNSVSLQYNEFTGKTTPLG
ncbi:hypothetical protein [Clostridium sp. E02]|uniref:hypothetical protein n=1 Tax=Clostridium sp. E02 TaxID=2487134 RepID=UPI0013DE77E2|nr:hypothetical protein [Clostridium sp. E02]